MKPTLTKILAASGAVLLLAGWGVQAATATPQTDDTANTVTEDTSAAVSMEEAKTIALNDAGVNAEDARFYETKGDYEDGRVVYEVEFVAGNTEYDYEIEKATGKILNKDHEIESENYVRTTQDNTTASNDTAASDKGTAAILHRVLHLPQALTISRQQILGSRGKRENDRADQCRCQCQQTPPSSKRKRIATDGERSMRSNSITARAI